MGNFSYGDWTFDPSQGNWDINSGTGKPAPAADFSWSGKSKSTDYSYAMVSRAIDGTQWDCSHLFLSFDISLEDRYLTSTEMMTIEILYDNAWHQLGEFANNGSFDWTTETFGIDAARGKGFMIRFLAHGADSYNILHWYIDNISVYGNCLPPEGLDWEATAENITLNWMRHAPTSAGIISSGAIQRATRPLYWSKSQPGHSNDLYPYSTRLV